MNESNTTQSLEFTEVQTPKERLLAIMSAFKMEMKFRFEVKNNRVRHKYIDIVAQNGNNTNKNFYVGKEIESISVKSDTSNLITGLRPTGGTPENASNAINLDGYSLTSAQSENGRFVLKNGKILDVESNKKWSRYLVPDEITIKGEEGYVIGKFEGSQTTQFALANATIAALKERTKVNKNYEVEFAINVDVEIGDRINCIHEESELYISSRILTIERDFLEGTSVLTLGEEKIIKSNLNLEIIKMANSLNKKYDAISSTQVKFIRSETAPDGGKYIVWVDTSRTPNIQNNWDEEKQEWVRVTPVSPDEVGAFGYESGIALTDQVNNISIDTTQLQTDAEEIRKNAEQIRLDMQKAREELDADIVALQEDVDAKNSDMTQLINSNKVDTDNALTDANTAISDANNKISATDENVTNINTSITNINNELATKVEKEEVDTLKQTVTNQGTSIKQNSDLIALKADSETVDTLSQTVTSQGTLIEQNADAIALKASSVDVDAVKETVTAHDSKLTQTAKDITSLVTKTDNTNTALSEVKQTADGLTTKVGTIEQNADSTSTKLSELEQNVNGFKTTVSNTYETKQNVDAKANKALEDAKDYAISQINQTATSITQTVSEKYADKNYVASQIEQKAGSITQTVAETYSSKTDTDTKIGTALNSAKSDTDEKLSKLGTFKRYSWSSDGKDRFTRYNVKNLLPSLDSTNDILKLKNTSWSTVKDKYGNSFAYTGNWSGIVVNALTLVEIGKTYSYSVLITNNTNKSLSYTCYSNTTTVPYKDGIIVPANSSVRIFNTFKVTTITQSDTYTRFETGNATDGDDIRQSSPVFVEGNFTDYLSLPSTDYDNSTPRYIGRSLKDSNSPSDYKWEPNPERKPWTAYAQGVNGEGLSLMPYGGQLQLGTNQPFVMGFGISNTTWKDGWAYLDTKTGSTAIIYEILPQNGAFFNFIPENGKTYTQSIRIKTDRKYSPDNSAIFTWYTTDGHNQQPASILPLNNNEYLVYSTYTWNKTGKSLRAFDIFNLHTAFGFRESTATYLAFKEPKIELVNAMGIPTPWTPAPSEDPLGAIPKYVGTAALPYEDPYKYEWKLNPAWLEVNTETLVSDQYSQSVQDLNGFKTVVGATYQTKDAMSGYYNKNQVDSAIVQKADSITSSVSSVYETKTNSTSNLNSAKSYADTQATNAKNSAVSTASADATTKANAAKTAAITESKTYTDAQLKITSDSITSTISKMTGAGNLVAKSTFEDGQKGNWTSGSLDQTIYKPDDTPSKLSRILQWSTRDNYEDQWFDIKAGETYYFEAYLSAYLASYPVRFGMHMMSSDGTNEWVTRASVSKGVDLQLVSGEYTVPSGSKMIKARPFLQIDGNSDFGIAKAVGMRIENVTVAYSKIQQTENSINLSVSNVYETKTNSTSNLTNAKSYADTQATNAKNSAVSTASADATTKANNALSSAKTYADSQINVSKDGILSTVSSTYTKQTDFTALQSQYSWTTITAATDLNNYKTNGNYFMKGTLTNAPISAWAYLIVDYVASDIITQTIWKDNSPTSQYTRTYNGSWSEWVKIADSATIISTINQSSESVNISASKINLAGAVTISSLATDARNRLDTAYDTSNTAKTNAGTAQSKADSAYNLANTANGTANTANNQINSWKKTGTTKIDGGNIYADSLSAISANLGTMKAGSIVGVDITSVSDNKYIHMKDGSLSAYDLSTKATTYLSPTGLINNNSANMKFYLDFTTQGMSIRPDSSNTELARNVGIDLYGDNTYIDFHSASTNSQDAPGRLWMNSNSDLELSLNTGRAMKFTNNFESDNYPGNIMFYTNEIHVKNNRNSNNYSRIFASSFSQQSTHSSKQDFENISTKDLLNAVNQTDIVKYHFIDEVRNGKPDDYVGFVINDDGKSPYQTSELLINRDGTGFNTTTAVGVMMGAIKELSKQNKELQAKVDTLYSFIESIDLNKITK